MQLHNTHSPILTLHVVPVAVAVYKCLYFQNYGATEAADSWPQPNSVPPHLPPKIGERQTLHKVREA